MKKIGSLLPIIALVVVGLMYAVSDGKNTTSVSPESQVLEEKTTTISQTIQVDKAAEPIVVTSNLIEGQSVLAALLTEQSLVVEIKEYDFGTLVESINGRKNGEDKKYWTFKVNDQEATVGAGEYLLKDGDKVVWEFKSL